MSSSNPLAALIFQSGVAEDQAGRPALAETCYRQVMALDPAHAGAHYRLGLLACRDGRSDLAIDCFSTAVELDAAAADYRVDLALVLATRGRFDEAERWLREAVRLDPERARIRNELGNALGQLGRFEQAAAEYGVALQLDPAAPEPCCNLAQVLYRLGRLDEAEAACREALRRQPDCVEAHNHLGMVLSGLGRFAEAERCYREALRLNPGFAEAHRNLGDVFGNLQSFEAAVTCYREALLLKPEFPTTWNHLGMALTSLGRDAEADFCYREALRLKPDYLGARLNRCMGRLPLIYRNEAEIERVRAEYAAELDAACRLDTLPAAYAETVGRAPFLLAYQGRCDREFQGRYGGFVADVMASFCPQWALPPAVAPPFPGEPIRVGILSAYFYNHSNWKIPIKGWLRGLDKSRFELFGYYIGHRQDEETAVARTLCHRFVHGLSGLANWAEAIRADRLHVLLIPGIGMDSETASLAALRLAPVQATSWGHPDTSGMPTIDDFLSSDLMEPPDADAHYTERLVRLPNLSIWYEPPDLAPEPLSRADLGVPAEAVVYWCCQSLFKYLPRYDGVFARIAAAVPEARFLFIEYHHGERTTAIFRERLAAAFAAAGLDAERHCLFLPRMSMERFAAISRIADVFLDSLGWSGCNSTLEALAWDLPVVTMAGDLMRGRHSAAILTMLGMPELIAADPASFIDLAVGLGRDPARRQALAARIAANKHRLYCDQAAIDGLAAYLDAAARRSSAGNGHGRSREASSAT